MKQVFEKNDLSITAIEKTGFRGFPMMFHPHMEVLYVLNGTIRVTVDEVERELHPGELCAVFPYVLHSYEDAPEATFRLLLFSPEYVREAEKNLFETKPEIPFFSLDPTLAFLTERGVACLRSRDALHTNTACGYLTALVGELLLRSSLTQASTTQNTTIQNILIHCNEHFSEHIDIKHVAEACFVSESYVSKVFANKLGCSFREYINALRTNHAKRLLEKTDLKIIDIMHTCGFQNQGSFNRVFLDLCGKTPRQYRQHCFDAQTPSRAAAPAPQAVVAQSTDDT